MGSLRRGWESGRIGNEMNPLHTEALQAEIDGRIDQKAALDARIAKMQLRQQMYTPDTNSIEDVQKQGIGSVPGYIAAQMGQGMASMADPLAVSAGLGAAGRIASNFGPTGKVIGLAAQGAGLAIPYMMSRNQLRGEQVGNQNRDEVLMNSTTPQQRMDSATEYANFAAVPDSAFPGIVGRQLSGLSRAGGAVGRKSVMGAGVKTIGGMGMEGGTEALQSEMSHRYLGDLNPNRDTSGDTMDNWNNFAAGAIGSGPVAAAGAYAEAGHNRLGAGVDRVKDAAGNVIDIAGETGEAISNSGLGQKAKGIFGRAKDKVKGSIVDILGDDDRDVTAQSAMDAATDAVGQGTAKVKKVVSEATAAKDAAKLDALTNKEIAALKPEEYAGPQDRASVIAHLTKTDAARNPVIMAGLARNPNDKTAAELLARLDASKGTEEHYGVLDEAADHLINRHEASQFVGGAVGYAANIAAGVVKKVAGAALDVGKNIVSGAAAGLKRNMQGASADAMDGSNTDNKQKHGKNFSLYDARAYAPGPKTNFGGPDTAEAAQANRPASAYDEWLERTGFGQLNEAADRGMANSRALSPAQVTAKVVQQEIARKQASVLSSTLMHATADAGFTSKDTTLKMRDNGFELTDLSQRWGVKVKGGPDQELFKRVALGRIATDMHQAFGQKAPAIVAQMAHTGTIDSAPMFELLKSLVENGGNSKMGQAEVEQARGQAAMKLWMMLPSDVMQDLSEQRNASSRLLRGLENITRRNITAESLAAVTERLGEDRLKRMLAVVNGYKADLLPNEVMGEPLDPKDQRDADRAMERSSQHSLFGFGGTSNTRAGRVKGRAIDVFSPTEKLSKAEADLRRHLGEDTVGRPTLFKTSTDPKTGEVKGLDTLPSGTTRLQHRMDQMKDEIGVGQSIEEKIAADFQGRLTPAERGEIVTDSDRANGFNAAQRSTLTDDSSTTNGFNVSHRSAFDVMKDSNTSEARRLRYFADYLTMDSKAAKDPAEKTALAQQAAHVRNLVARLWAKQRPEAEWNTGEKNRWREALTQATESGYKGTDTTYAALNAHESALAIPHADKYFKDRHVVVATPHSDELDEKMSHADVFSMKQAGKDRTSENRRDSAKLNAEEGDEDSITSDENLIMFTKPNGDGEFAIPASELVYWVRSRDNYKPVKHGNARNTDQSYLDDLNGGISAFIDGGFASAEVSPYKLNPMNEAESFADGPPPSLSLPSGKVYETLGAEGNANMTQRNGPNRSRSWNWRYESNGHHKAVAREQMTYEERKAFDEAEERAAELMGEDFVQDEGYGTDPEMGERERALTGDLESAGGNEKRFDEDFATASEGRSADDDVQREKEAALDERAAQEKFTEQFQNNKNGTKPRSQKDAISSAEFDADYLIGETVKNARVGYHLVMDVLRTALKPKDEEVLGSWKDLKRDKEEKAYVTYDAYRAAPLSHLLTDENVGIMLRAGAHPEMLRLVERGVLATLVISKRMSESQKAAIANNIAMLDTEVTPANYLKVIQDRLIQLGGEPKPHELLRGTETPVGAAFASATFKKGTALGKTHVWFNEGKAVDADGNPMPKATPGADMPTDRAPRVKAAPTAHPETAATTMRKPKYKMVNGKLEMIDDGRAKPVSAPRTAAASNIEPTKVTPRAKAPSVGGVKLTGGPNVSAENLAKDQAKSDQATKFIGRGSERSSTNSYAKDWGDRANTGIYTAKDRVFISAEGNRAGRLTVDRAEVERATAAGATIITDRDDVAGQGRSHIYNVGERNVAHILAQNGYEEVGYGIWTPAGAEPAKAATTAPAAAKARLGPMRTTPVGQTPEILKGPAPTAQPVTQGRVTFDPNITRDAVKANPNTLFVYADNDNRSNHSGLAAEMVGERNAAGVRTRGGLAWTDTKYDANVMKLKNDFARLLAHKGPIVMAANGLRVSETAPRTAAYLAGLMKQLGVTPEGPKPSFKATNAKTEATKPTSPDSIDEGDFADLEGGVQKPRAEQQETPGDEEMSHSEMNAFRTRLARDDSQDARAEPIDEEMTHYELKHLLDRIARDGGWDRNGTPRLSAITANVAAGLENSREVMRALGFKSAPPQFSDVAAKLLSDPNIDVQAFIRDAAKGLSYMLANEDNLPAIKAAVAADPALAAQYKDTTAALRVKGEKWGKASTEAYRQIAENALKGELAIRTAKDTTLGAALLQMVKQFISSFKKALNSEAFNDVVRNQINTLMEKAKKPIDLETNFTKVTFQQAVDGDPEAAKVLAYLSKNPNISLTGSIVLADSGSIYRNAEHMLHDLDFVLAGDLASGEKYLRAMFPGAHQTQVIKDKTHTTTSWIVPKPGATVVPMQTVNGRLKAYKVMMGGKEIGRAWKSESGDHKLGDAGTIVDFFTGDVDRAVKSIAFTTESGQHSVKVTSPGSIFSAKLGYNRSKDGKDYARYVPDAGRKLNAQTSQVERKLNEEESRQEILGLIEDGDFNIAKLADIARRTEMSAEDRAEANSMIRDLKQTVSGEFNVGGLAQKTVDSWSKKFAGGAKITVISIPKGHIFAQLMGSGGRDINKMGGAYVKINGEHTIANFMDGHRPKVTSLSRLAHEFGHALENIAFENAPQSTKDKLVAAYQGDMAALGVTPEAIMRFVSPARLFDDKLAAELEGMEDWRSDSIRKDIALGVMPTVEAEGSAQYITSFTEWFAENFSKFVTSDPDANLAPEIKSFWEKLVVGMKKFFNEYVKQYLPDENFKDWVESLAGKKPTEQADAQSGLYSSQMDELSVEGKIWKSGNMTAVEVERGDYPDGSKFNKKAAVYADGYFESGDYWSGWFDSVKAAEIAGQKAGLQTGVLKPASSGSKRNAQTPRGGDAAIRKLLSDAADSLDTNKEALRLLNSLSEADRYILQNDVMSNEGVGSILPSRMKEQFREWMKDYGGGEEGYAWENLNDNEYKYLEYILEEPQYQDTMDVLFATAFLGKNELNAQTPNGDHTFATGGEMAEAKAWLKKVSPTTVLDFMKSLTDANGKTYSGEYIDAANLIQVSMTAGAGILNTTYHEGLHRFFSQFVKSNPQVLAMFKRFGSDKKLIEKLHDLLSGYPEAQAQLADGEERLAYAFQFWKAGMLTIDAPTTSLFQKIAKGFRRIFGLMRDSEHALALFQAFDEGKLANPSTAGKVIAAEMSKGENAKAMRRNMDKLLQYVGAATLPAEVVLNNEHSETARAIGKLMFSNPGKAKSGEQGYLNAKANKSKQFANKANSIFAGLDKPTMDAIQEHMQSQTELSAIRIVSHREAVGKLRDIMSEFHDYMVGAGMRIGKVDKYYPTVWNVDALHKNKDAFIKMLVNKYAQQMNPDGGDAHKAAARIHTALIDRQGVDSGKLNANREDGVLAPFFAGQENRILPWLDGADKAAYLNKDMQLTVSSYIHQGVRATEYTRRFGENGVVLEAMLKKTRAELTAAALIKKEEAGWTEKQAKSWLGDQMRDISMSVGAIEGTLGKDISPSMRKFSSYMIAYQNMRLLPHMIFSSFVDPLAQVARGAPMKSAVETFAYGMKSVFRAWADLFRDMPKERVKDEWTKLAELIGAIEMEMFNHHVAEEYSSIYMSPLAKKINDTLFKLNGMEAWDRANRTMATKWAVRFIEQHKALPDKVHSARWLAELGLDAATIPMNADGNLITTAEELSVVKGIPMDQAKREISVIHDALNQWVQGAVITPNAAQRPGWSSDPNYASMFHLKQFSYSFQQTIMNRAVSEAGHGNVAPLGALTLFIPTMVCADLMKGLIQGGGSLPAYMAGRDAGEVMLAAVGRSGVGGVGDIGANALHDWTSLGGPATEQLADAMRDGFGPKTFMKAMPVHAAYEHLVSKV
jgi:uncharacterized protein (DUF736 family)